MKITQKPYNFFSHHYKDQTTETVKCSHHYKDEIIETAKCSSRKPKQNFRGKKHHFRPRKEKTQRIIIKKIKQLKTRQLQILKQEQEDDYYKPIRVGNF